MSTPPPIEGLKFGRLTITKLAETRVSPSGNRTKMVECECECGNLTTVALGKLRMGKPQSCGCLHLEKAMERIAAINAGPPKPLKPVAGLKFGRLTIIERSEPVILASGKKQQMVKVTCECGTVKVVGLSMVQSGGTQSCGCLHMEQSTANLEAARRANFKPVEGLQFGRLTVIKRTEPRIQQNGKPRQMVEVVCECGTVKVVGLSSILCGKTKSCGCLQSDTGRENIKAAHAAPRPIRVKSLDGLRFGRLTAITRAEPKVLRSGKKRQMYEVVCDCGTRTIVACSSLHSGLTTSCGCLRDERSMENLELANAAPRSQLQLTGQRFGKLLITGEAEKRNRQSYWHALCDCGNTCIVKGALLRFGSTGSCGCRVAELMRENGRANAGRIFETRRARIRDRYLGKVFGKLTVINVIHRTSARAVCLCECGSETECAPSDLTTGKTQSCGCSANGTSAPEVQLLDFVRSLVPSALHNVSLPGSRLRFDVVCEQQKLALEFNGVYWHRAEARGDRYHQDKRLLAERNGYDLISVWQDDWYYQRPMIEHLIRDRLGMIEKRQLAVCDVSEVDSITAQSHHRAFNHQRDNAPGTLHIGLSESNVLLAVATFRCEGSGLELTRYSERPGVAVAGGLLLCLQRARACTGVQMVVTFSDRDYCNGSAFAEAGFKLIGSSVQLTERSKNFDSRSAPTSTRESKTFPCYNSGLDHWVMA